MKKRNQPKGAVLLRFAAAATAVVAVVILARLADSVK